jgi:hypothetical protein
VWNLPLATLICEGKTYYQSSISTEYISAFSASHFLRSVTFRVLDKIETLKATILGHPYC